MSREERNVTHMNECQENIEIERRTRHVKRKRGGQERRTRKGGILSLL